MDTQIQLRVHNDLEYIKQDPEFPFDTHDEIEDILAHYNMNMPKDPELRKIIEEEIAAIADQHQTAEIAGHITEEPDEISLLTQMLFAGTRS